MSLPVTPTSIETQSRIMVGPPPVGFRQSECAAGGAVGGGLCLALFEEICYAGGMVVTCATSWPVCIVVGVGVAAYAICLTAAETNRMYEQGKKIIADEVARRNQACLDVPTPTGETPLETLARLVACYKAVNDWAAEAFEMLLDFLYGRSKGRGALPIGTSRQ